MKNKERYKLLYHMYTREIDLIMPGISMDFSQFTSMVSEQLKNASFIEIEAKGQYGFLYYFFREDNIAHITVPVYGYYAENEKMMVRLFQKLAAEVKTKGRMEYLVHLYHHDYACIQALHTMQFGNIAEKCIKAISSER